MSDPLDDVLISTLNRAADEAPPPPPDLYRTVVRRHARRRGSLVAAAAGIVVLALLGGVVGALKFTRDDPPPVTTPNTVEELWPDAVRTLPKSLDGLGYRVEAILPDGRAVAVVETPQRQVDLVLLRGDVNGWSAQRLATYPATKTVTRQIFNVRANDEWLIWQVGGGPGPSGIWSARLDRPQPKQIVSVTGMLGTASITLDGDQVVYGPSAHGVRIVPAAGGTPTLLPGTSGYYTLHWPWLIDNGQSPHHPPGKPTILWNYRTGERKEAVFTSVTYRDTCSPVWCVSMGDDGKPPAGDDGPIEAVRFDGSDRQSFPGYVTNVVALTPIRERYLVLIRPDRAAGGRQTDLIDLIEHRTIELGRIGSSLTALIGVQFGQDTFSWPASDGTLKVLDLRKLP